MDLAFVTKLIQFIFGLACLIILHELGHFIVARLLGVEVEEFGIGFPPRLVKLFEAGGTEYTLNAIPLGGFVRPKGENDPTVEGGLAAAKPAVRLAVLSAGAGMNILAAIVLGTIVFYQLGEPVENQVVIQDVSPASPAELAGLRAGDLLVQVDGQTIDGTEKLQAVVKENGNQEIEIVYQRDGQNFTTALVPRDPPPPNQGAIGIYMGNPTRPTTVGRAFVSGLQVVYENARGIITLPIRMFSGQAQPEEGRLVGYKGMFDIYQRIPSPLYFFMAISVSLGVVNLFPIPALDGGRILLTLPEIFLRRRIPPQYENMIHLAGFALLIILLIYVNIQDFTNPIPLP